MLHYVAIEIKTIMYIGSIDKSDRYVMTPSGGEAVSEIRAGVGDLRAFVTVARLGAVARAAEALGRTQPSVSARLAALEPGIVR